MNNKQSTINIIRTNSESLVNPTQFSLYTIIFIEKGRGIYHADCGSFAFKGPVMLFSTPMQQIFINQHIKLDIVMLQFHGDFYCIEFHRSEVSCNGLLFNNCYIQPSVNLETTDCQIFKGILIDLEQEFKGAAPNDTLLRAYLQLCLAKASAIKIRSVDKRDFKEADRMMEHFRELIDQNYLTLQKPGDYARLLNISPNTLTKRSNKYFNKTPSQLISERLIMEAKKQLHLTRQSIKEIAYNLKFQDEFYFSRVFKKFTKVSPQAFRDKTGISIVANLSDYK